VVDNVDIVRNSAHILRSSAALMQCCKESCVIVWNSTPVVFGTIVFLFHEVPKYEPRTIQTHKHRQVRRRRDPTPVEDVLEQDSAKGPEHQLET